MGPGMSAHPTTEWIAERIAVPAVRYALGRRTYVVGDVCDSVTAILPWLDAQTTKVIIRDIDAADDLGAEQDLLRWLDLRKKLARHLSVLEDAE